MTTAPSAAEGAPRSSAALVLLAGVLAAAVCALVYELLAGTVASYLRGNSITQFSLVIGFFLTAMGVGSYLSGRVQNHLARWFVAVEIASGLVGGLSALVAYAAFALTSSYIFILVGSVFAVGVLVGLEIPLVVRILREDWLNR